MPAKQRPVSVTYKTFWWAWIGNRFFASVGTQVPVLPWLPLCCVVCSPARGIVWRRVHYWWVWRTWNNKWLMISKRLLITIKPSLCRTQAHNRYPPSQLWMSNESQEPDNKKVRSSPSSAVEATMAANGGAKYSSQRGLCCLYWTVCPLCHVFWWVSFKRQSSHLLSYW